MGKTLIIPAIDILGGKCVRLSRGRYDRVTVYSDDPLEIACQFEEAGIQRLHLVDLDGARAGHIVNAAVLKRIASGTSLLIDFGGGLTDDRELKTAFDNGAHMVTGGTIAVRDPGRFLKWMKTFGPDRIILGADSRDGQIAISGWEKPTRLPVLDFIKEYQDQGIRQVISTDITRDGMLTGPAYGLYREILALCPGLMLIASGGIASMEDIRQLASLGLSGVITGKALYSGNISLGEISQYNQTET